jgi:UDP-N-acetylmuramoyl-tripeptide--D-alanyl-D-alanine ligase
MHDHSRLRDFVENALVVPVLSACAALIIRTRRPLVIGITGSVGKTTTKETVGAVLMHASARDAVGVVHKTPGNMNNNLGVAMTVLRYEDWFATARGWLMHLLLLPFRTLALATVAPYPNVLLLEIAAGTHGNIPGNCRIVRPTIGVVTEIGPAHLEHFGTIEELILPEERHGSCHSAFRPGRPERQ